MRDQINHLAHRSVQPDQRGTRDDRMPDVQLLDVFVDGDGIDVSIIQTVPGENDESHFPGRLGSSVDLLQLCAPASANPTLSEFAGVDLDLRRANFLTLPDLLEIGIDEDREVDCRI